MILARLEIPWQGQTYSAELGEDLVWECEHSFLERALNILYGRPLDPPLGRPGAAQIAAATAGLDARVTYLLRFRGRPDRVYR